MDVWLRYDLRSPSFGTSTADNIRITLEQIEWADSRGFDVIQFAEHHGFADNYCPSPLLMTAAAMAKTKHLRANPTLVFPYYDPVRLAEDCCLLDNLATGRFDLTFALGYIPSEFEMMGVPFERRAEYGERGLHVLRTIFSGDAVDFDGRQGRVTPSPYRAGGPKIYVGGAIMAAARRAAKYGDGYYPMKPTSEFIQAYETACAELGKAPGKVLRNTHALVIYVSDDPERAWSQISPYAYHEAKSYADLALQTNMPTPFPGVVDATSLRKTGVYRSLTPEEAISYCLEEATKGTFLTIAPMVGGLPEDLSWAGLEAFTTKVLPFIPADEGSPSSVTRRAL